MEFKGSRTRQNLLRAFAGESQAIMRYSFAASKAKTLKLNVIERAFTFTAQQEREHAEIFFNFLNGEPREDLEFTAAYPIENANDALTLLRTAQHNEYQEYSVEYATFAEIAKQEGFGPIATSFDWIAKIEQTHGNRFERFANLLEQDMLFKAEGEIEWMCLNCGHIHRGNAAPEKCPVCSHDKGYFLRADLAPFR